MIQGLRRVAIPLTALSSAALAANGLSVRFVLGASYPGTLALSLLFPTVLCVIASISCAFESLLTNKSGVRHPILNAFIFRTGWLEKLGFATVGLAGLGCIVWASIDGIWDTTVIDGQYYRYFKRSPYTLISHHTYDVINAGSTQFGSGLQLIALSFCLMTALACRIDPRAPQSSPKALSITGE